ncbi:MAG: Hsp20/alpha crystallin family protein [Chloroflexi bacterium]|jgi:HSP20 family protein|nr:Hsp20/alpha crystallin family protein [Chloroflexota bacterium]
MLTRWDPFREMMEFEEAFDRFFDRAWSGRRSRGSLTLPLDVVETSDHYVVKASIPGIDPDNLEITFNQNTLTIKGEIPQEDVEDSRYHLRERLTGSFERSLYLRDEIDADRIEANYEAGVLTLTLPKSEEVKPKRIPVQVGASTKIIEGTAK